MNKNTLLDAVFAIFSKPVLSHVLTALVAPVVAFAIDHGVFNGHGADEVSSHLLWLLMAAFGQ